MLKLFLRNIFLITSPFIFLISCSEDKPTEPEEQNNSNSEFELITTQTVGPEGGKIETNGFKLIVPKASLTQSTQVSVYSSETFLPFGNNNDSKSYNIIGLPYNFKQPIKISIKSSNTDSGNKYLAFGQRALNCEHFDFGYQFVKTKDSAGFLITYLNPSILEFENSLEKTNENGLVGHIWTIVKGYGTIESYNNNFLIHYPTDLEVRKALNLGNYLEEAYEKILDLGFNYDLRYEWPISVYLKELPEGTDGVAYRSKTGIEDNWLEFNTKSNDDALRTTAGHEFFHFVQSLYDSRRLSARWASVKPNHYWFDEATAAWIEEKFSDESDYRPDVWSSDNEMSPFAGLQKYPSNNPFDESSFLGIDVLPLGWKIDKEVREHGYGSTPIIKYLVNNYGEKIIIDTYEKIKKGDNIIDIINPNEWWENFLKEYMIGNVYSSFGFGNWSSRTSGDISVKSKNNWNISFTENYQDLSGKIFKIMLYDHPEITENTNINIIATGAENKAISVFKHKPLTYIGSDNNSITIYNTRKFLTENYNRFFVLVSNNLYKSPYTKDDHEITLNINLIEESTPSLDFTKGNFSFDFNPIVKRTDENGSTEEPLAGTWHFYIFNAIGSFSGKTFTGSFNERSGEYIGSLTATLDESLSKITTFTYKFEYNPNSESKSVYEVSGKDIPVTLIDDDKIRCGIAFDQNICTDNLTSVSYKKEYTYNGSPVTKELSDYTCDDYSIISISFNK